MGLLSNKAFNQIKGLGKEVGEAFSAISHGNSIKRTMEDTISSSRSAITKGIDMMTGADESVNREIMSSASKELKSGIEMADTSVQKAMTKRAIAEEAEAIDIASQKMLSPGQKPVKLYNSDKVLEAGDPEYSRMNYDGLIDRATSKAGIDRKPELILMDDPDAKYFGVSNQNNSITLNSGKAKKIIGVKPGEEMSPRQERAFSNIMEQEVFHETLHQKQFDMAKTDPYFKEIMGKAEKLSAENSGITAYHDYKFNPIESPARVFGAERGQYDLTNMAYAPQDLLFQEGAFKKTGDKFADMAIDNKVNKAWGKVLDAMDNEEPMTRQFFENILD